MMPTVFVDSAAWIALLHRGDGLHARAVEVYRRLVSEQQRLLTTSLVLVEVASAFAATRRRLAVELEARYRGTEIGEIVWIDEDLYRRGWELYRERSDKEWSLVDCASFVVMGERGITAALTSDHHFEQASFKKLL